MGESAVSRGGPPDPHREALLEMKAASKQLQEARDASNGHVVRLRAAVARGLEEPSPTIEQVNEALAALHAAVERGDPTVAVPQPEYDEFVRARDACRAAELRHEAAMAGYKEARQQAREQLERRHEEEVAGGEDGALQEIMRPPLLAGGHRSHGHRLQLPAAVARLTRLERLGVCGAGGDRWSVGASHPALVMNATSQGALPPVLAALGGQLAELEVEGLALPRRQLGQFTALTRLALVGWEAVSRCCWCCCCICCCLRQLQLVSCVLPPWFRTHDTPRGRRMPAARSPRWRCTSTSCPPCQTWTSRSMTIRTGWRTVSRGPPPPVRLGPHGRACGRMGSLAARIPRLPRRPTNSPPPSLPPPAPPAQLLRAVLGELERCAPLRALRLAWGPNRYSDAPWFDHPAAVALLDNVCAAHARSLTRLDTDILGDVNDPALLAPLRWLSRLECLKLDGVPTPNFDGGMVEGGDAAEVGASWRLLPATLTGLTSLHLAELLGAPTHLPKDLGDLELLQELVICVSGD